MTTWSSRRRRPCCGARCSARPLDSAGRPAIEISRFDKASGTNEAAFEDPATGATLETLSTVPYDATTKTGGGYYRDIYQSVTYTSTVPANPYDR